MNCHNVILKHHTSRLTQRLHNHSYLGGGVVMGGCGEACLVESFTQAGGKVYP